MHVMCAVYVCLLVTMYVHKASVCDDHFTIPVH